MMISPRKIAILGSTGSIGRSTLEVVRFLQGKLQVVALAAHRSCDELIRQASEFQPRWVVACDEHAARDCNWSSLPRGTELLVGPQAIERIVQSPEVDVVVAAVVGSWFSRRWMYVAMCLASLGASLLFWQFNTRYDYTFLATVMLAGGVMPIALLYRGNLNLTRAALGGGLIVLTCAYATILMTGFDPVAAVLGGVGKDATLTGRTVLWEFGWNAFMDYPLHGHGYKGYWMSQQTTVLLLRYVMQQDLIHFHNDFVETAVAFGIWGPLLLVAGLFAAFRRACLEFLYRRSVTALWSGLFVMFIITYATAENLLFVNHGFLQVVFVMASAARDRPKRHS
ncbi:MAG: hypothetical protein HC850_12965 [Rhodomicrobium sp.]|nr:hypothetical protein [Rhodomicrobium sp.]